MVSVLLAFLTLLPRPYYAVPDSTEEFRKLHRKVVRYKYATLISSGFLFLLGFVLFFGQLAGWA
jgi:amino acid transporter